MAQDEKQPLIWYDIDTLLQWDENPNDGDVGSIYQSIRRFGYNDIIAVRGNVIKGGNHRIKALDVLRHEKWHPSQCKHKSNFLRVDDGIWFVGGFDISDMSDIEADAFALALNRTSRLGYDDPSELLKVLDRINQHDSQLLDSISYTLEDMDFMNDIVEKQRAISVPLSPSRSFGDHHKQIKPVLYLEEIELFEQAMKLTKERNRGKALLKICAEYIENNGE